MELDLHRGGSGAPLVLVHGIGHTWRGWRPMLPLLEERFDVLAPDLPGFGHSPPLPDDEISSPNRLADYVESAMDDAGFGTAHIAGNSLGGWIALELARRGRARTCVPISPAGLLYARETGWARGILRGMRWLALNAPTPEPLLRNPVTRSLFGGPTLGRPWRADPDELIEETELFASAPGFDRTLDATVDLQAVGLPDITCPVLVLWGRRDVILLPRQGRRFERLIPNCELRYLKGLGHVPMSDDPELLADAISGFALARESSPAPPEAAPA
jgi:pimeloyl-ACP methyl ester carboxylesterase